ncbi:double-cubane-cluster-containing anaerobic reductase [Desulfuribacillus alkaliarsenatis]|uniref:3-hydroxyacyl-ACP dehydratase n=1 Tax=Desulfuribacillus alkaliarsenatis TaxID=766136 RepID=A0A1E5FZL1_9FIRM|nr:double-cubane-cluster-containing anaerobic reductase [Desulfuribacillus alkaliarsenatis]OEF95932.1 hypothetical protein BHF68_11115 [Desulfuribacillus alkaliarsenatis]
MRPKAMEYFDQMIANNAVAIKNVKEAGRKVVGYYCVFSPIELIEATGALPVGLCATKQEPIADGEKVLPRNLCPLIKSSYGFAASGKCPFFHFADAIVAETTCDGKKKMYELMEKMKPMIVLDIPNTTNLERRKQHWTEEILRMKDFLEDTLGQEVTIDNLRNTIATYNEERKNIMELVSLNKHEPAPMSGIDLLKVMWGRSFQIDREEFKTNLLALIDEVKDIVANREQSTAEKQPKKPRILVTGSPTGVGQEKVMKIIEDAGGQVILQEACSGIKGFVDLVDETADPYEALAAKYMDIPCSCLSPNPRRMELTSGLCNEYAIDGVVDITLQACHTYNIESYTLKEYLREHNGVPLLQIETDYSQSDNQQIKLRVDTFLEMIQG